MQITIIGVGLIGGSFALALKKRKLAGHIVGCDRPATMQRALAIGAIDEAREEPEAAVQGSKIVLLATPVGAIIDMIERVGPLMPPEALLTDTGSTKQEIVAKARDVFGAAAAQRFLPGHPLAGKEQGGIEYAEPDLFQGAIWALTPAAEAETSDAAEGFVGLLRGIGAIARRVDPALHDRVCAFTSHLPQLLSTALAATLVDEFRDDAGLLTIGGRGLRDMSRLAQSPYSLWRDVALTNSANIERAILLIEEHLAHIRENLRTRELETEFLRAQRLPRR